MHEGYSGFVLFCTLKGEKKGHFLEKKWRQKPQEALTHRERDPSPFLHEERVKGTTKAASIRENSLATALGSTSRQHAALALFRRMINPGYGFILFSDSVEIRGRQTKRGESSREECQIKESERSEPVRESRRQQCDS